MTSFILLPDLSRQAICSLLCCGHRAMPDSVGAPPAMLPRDITSARHPKAPPQCLQLASAAPGHAKTAVHHAAGCWRAACLCPQASSSRCSPETPQKCCLWSSLLWCLGCWFSAPAPYAGGVPAPAGDAGLHKAHGDTSPGDLLALSAPRGFQGLLVSLQPPSQLAAHCDVGWPPRSSWLPCLRSEAEP